MAEKLLLEDWSFQDEVSLGEIYDVESKFIKTEPELQEFHSSLTTLEEKQLEENLQKVGCINPLIVWKRDMHGFVLIDGHYRFKICKQNNIGFKVREIKLTSIDQAKAFMLEEQLGRRNLTIEQLQYYRGLKYAGLTKIKGYGKLQNQGGG